ncbi:uncharacterized protein LOC115995020 isoform X4 [Quercus lobata]|uniref:uncharacterized protein LOC115995020 isoform X4 n=1 Tax=Quercus lobata TaxID=97700 RepID=UPI001243B9E7|nr:uncharacterized protein LOC115995020 isoform X4 [Quercus lobata]
MFLDGIIRRRLAALLLPWLRDEPELEVKLGFINSQAVARNLRLNTSVLNELIVDDPARFCFKDVTVESLSIRFSNWSETAFAIEVRGVHVTLSAGDLNEEGYSIKVGKPKDTFLEDMKKRLSMLDPEGSALHGALERILPTSFSRSQFRTSFWNLILKHCRLQMCDIRLQVQFPVLNDLFTCASEMKELNAESQYRTHGCLFRGLCGAIFLPLKKISCTVSGNGFEISFKRGDWINRVLLSTDMFTYIKLDALQLVDFKLWVPKLSLFFSPADLSMYSAIGKLSSIESKPARDGRQLWQLAARKFGHVTSAPRISFHKLVVVVCLWLRYVSAYEHFLSLVGYPSDHFLERSCTEMSNGKWFLSSIKYHWKVICDTEKELPAEAIARARRIARYRAALNVHSVKDTSMESVFTSHFRFLCKIVELLACILKLICNVFHAIVKFLHLRKVLVQDQRNDGDCGTVFEDPYARSCFVLNLGRLVITICQMNECQPSVNEKLESHIGISYSNFLSFCLSIEKLLLVYVQNTCEHSVLLSCGQLKVNSSSSFMEASVGESSSKSYPNSVEGHRMERVDDLKSILWGEPAQSFVFSETSNTVAADDVEGACILILNNILREMWLRWRRACLEFEERDIQYSENPCLLCEIKSSLVYPGLKNQDSGFWKCSLILGKLNLALGFSSLLSLSLLLRQVQDTLSRTEDNVRAMVLSRSPRGVNVQPEISEDSKYKFNGRGMKTAFLRIPEKHVELGIFIAGPHIHISLGKEFDGLNKDINHVVNQDDFHLVFELHNIEVAVWPTSRSDLVSLTGSLGSDDAEKKHLLLKEPQMIDLPKLDNEKYVSEGRVSLDLYLRVNGLDAYVEDLAEKLQSQVEVNLEDLAEKQQSDVLALKPMTVHLSSIRSYLHSFSTAVVAFSAAFCGKAMGITILSYMDELYALFQVVGGLHSAVSHVYHSFDPSGPVPEEYTTQETVLAEPEKEEIIVEGDPLIYVSVLFKIYGTFKLKSVDMVLHVSRRSEHVESSMKIFDALTSRKFAEGGLSDCGIRASVQQTSFEIPCKEQMEVLIDFSGIQSVIFRYQNQIGEHTDQSVLKDLSLQSLDSLYEMSLSTCMITLWLAPPEYASSSDSLSHMVENSTLMTDSEKRTHWLFTNIELSEIVIARCSLKNVLVGAHQLNKLQSSLSVGSEFRTISWRIKGGFVLLETTALAMFVRWLVLYLYCVRNLISVIQSSDQNIKKAEHEEDVTRLDDHFVKDNAQEMPCASRHGKKELLEAFIIDVSQFSLVLVIEDGSGGFREFVLEVDVHLEFELANMRRKLIFDLSRFSIISRVFQESVENKIQIPRFSSVTSINMSCSASGAPAKGLQHRNVIHLDNEASCSRDTIENCASEEFCLSHQNCILKQLGASVAVEKPENVPLHQNQAWLGRGSVSGFDVTISLSEIQMILSTISTFSGLFSNGATSKSNERIWTSGQESDNSMEPMFPNGAIVAIQDVDQHMYITVEEGDNKYNLVGAVHYSLVGERALFRVENHIGLSLLCHFSNNQSLTIARNQSASVFLRNSDITNQSPEISPFVSVQVAIPGSLTTSPLHLSLLEAQALAWRTRIMSVQDSKVYPGPFVVVDISRKSEDGLSVVVSPLIRIHNETRFSMELRFRRPQQNEDEFASVMLKTGETIDDSIAIFDAVNLSGELKKALTSLSVGNFLFSLRPEFSDGSINSKNSLSVEWSDDFEGGKAVCLSGFLDQLSYRVRKALFVGSMKCSFSTACCILKSNGAHVSSMHFLIQRIGRDVPVIQPDKSRGHLKNSDSPVALQEQKEIFLLPTLKVSNLLYSKIHVLLSERDVCTTNGYNLGSQETISSHSTVDFYVNPAIIFFTITLTDFNTSCKPVNSGDWIKKLLKKKSAVHYLDIDLDFGGGKYFASLRFSRGDRGILEATIFTSYSLKNDTDFSLYLFPPNKKPLSRDEAENFGSSISPELGLLLRPNSFGSWFLKSNKVQLKLLKDSASELLLDLDALSGLTEISLEVNEGSGVKSITKLGVSMGPLLREVDLPSQIVTMVPRYVVLNESEESIIVRQCYLQDDMEGIHINSKQKITLMLQNGISKGREFNIFENFIRKHRNANHDSLKYIRFQLDEPELSWSGPVCIASLGCFFVKFRKQKSNQTTAADTHITEFAAVCVVEKGSSLVLHFQKPPDSSLPYRIENGLRDVAITFYQQGSSEQEVLKSGCSVDYVWDDLTLPHKLVVLINGSLPLREINLDKVRAWKSFYKPWQHRGLASNSGDQRINIGEVTGMEMVKVGFEVYADGLTRVLRICEISSSNKGDSMLKSRAKIQLKVSHLAIHLLECRKQDGDESETSVNSPILIMRLGKINMDSVFTDQHKYNQISLQSLNLEEKWVGAPFAAMLRRHMVDYSEPNDCVLKIVFVLLPASSNVTQVKYSSIALQPVDLNLDEETLMRIAPFWRTSLSESKSQSRQFYFDHFEIHPIKIFANFLPGESYSSYSSAQETLRSLLHSVVKVPFIKNKVVELNGVLVTHALITMRELCIRCARHYSWYGMRAIYIAKGSQLLPPDFVSMFDDLASSSLDIFFDPSRGLRNLPGLTLGTFKFISKCIDGKGFSGTKRYFGDLEKTLRKAGSNVLFAAVTEISDSVLKGAEASGFNGMVSGFHQGILKLAMEPSLLGTALMEGGPDRKIKLDHSPGVDELYIEGYLQAMLDTLYRQEYLRVKVIENQVFLKNLPPNSSLIEEIMDHVKAFLISKALLKGDSSTTSRPLHHLQGERGWKIGPTVLTLCEHLFVSFAIRALRKQANKYIANVKWKRESDDDNQKAVVLAKPKADKYRLKFIWKWGIGKFVLSGIVAYVDGRLCRCIPNPVARRIVSGFLLSFLDNNSKE